MNRGDISNVLNKTFYNQKLKNLNKLVKELKDKIIILEKANKELTQQLNKDEKNDVKIDPLPETKEDCAFIDFSIIEEL